VLLVVVLVVDAPAVRLAGNADLVGRNAVVTAMRDSETTHSVPWARATYVMTFPESAPGPLSGSTHEYTTPYRQLFGGDPFPEHADFRVVFTGGDGFRLDGPEDAGSLRVITARTVADEAPRVRAAVITNVAAAVVLLGLDVLLFIVALRRTRRRGTPAVPPPPPGPPTAPDWRLPTRR
jgi:hypothetical protein